MAAASADRASVNVAAQYADPRSMLSLYRQLIALRRARAGALDRRACEGRAIGEVLVYRRFHAGRWITVALNFSDAPRTFDGAGAHEVLISTHLDRVRARRRSCSFARTNAALAARLLPPEGIVVCRLG